MSKQKITPHPVLALLLAWTLPGWLAWAWTSRTNPNGWVFALAIACTAAVGWLVWQWMGIERDEDEEAQKRAASAQRDLEEIERLRRKRAEREGPEP
jgi:hypothetical protein